MSYADLRIIAIVIVLGATYGVFNFMYAQSTITNSPVAVHAPNQTDYNTPDPGNVWDVLKAQSDISVNNPEIFFINSIFFSVLQVLIIVVILRFLRGTG